MTGVPVIYKQGSVRAMGAIGQAQRPTSASILTGNAPVAVASTGVREQGVGTPRKSRERPGGASLPLVPARSKGLL